MKDKLSNLTINILTYKTDKKILTDCINSLSKSILINIIENSSKFEDENYFKKLAANINVICTGSNLGYAAGHNFGISKVKTRYVLILNPDLICSADYFKKITTYLNDNLNFHIIGSQYEKNQMDKPAYGFFDKKGFNQETPVKNLNLQEVDWVVGCSMLIDLYKFKNFKIFDENFFLFYEETDLCKRIKLDGGCIFSSTQLVIDHYGEKGSFAIDPKNKLNYMKLRNWHLMWSSFYFHRKNYSYQYAFKLLIGTTLKSLVKFILFLIIFDKSNYTKYLFRFLGLINAMMGKKSWFRI